MIRLARVIQNISRLPVTGSISPKTEPSELPPPPEDPPPPLPLGGLEDGGLSLPGGGFSPPDGGGGGGGGVGVSHTQVISEIELLMFSF